MELTFISYHKIQRPSFGLMIMYLIDVPEMI